MNKAAIVGARNLWQSVTSEPKTMTAKEMALTTWGKVHAEVNMNPATGERWIWSDAHGVFVGY